VENVITLKKLAKLTNRNRIRKSAEIIECFEQEVAQTGKLSRALYLTRLMQMLREYTGEEHAFFSDLSAVERLDPGQLINVLSRIKNRLYTSINIYQSDWTIKEKSHNDRHCRLMLPFSVYIDDLRSPYNLGSIFRSADAFGISKIILSPDSPDPVHPRCRRTSMGTWNKIPWQRDHLKVLQDRKNVFCLEIGGTPIDQFSFPPSGTVIIGNEEYGISRQGLAIAEKSKGVVSIPMGGFKTSLNVSASFAVLMSWWFIKSLKNS
jgi:TrmH family RNA methyltransferase